ncbi:MAG TPA: ATP-grasp domain-containing protein [Acidimicrobiales bacterium]|nr:ATP-grasp domain-containing protein [Acidimicrobiales bacterium]
MTGAVVAVVAGAVSEEDRFYAERAPAGGVSLGDVMDSLERQAFHPRHVDPASDSFLDDLRAADLVFINMHGEYGEDGRLQGMLDYFGKLYTGSGVLAGAVALNKVTFKRLMSGCAMPVPRYALADHCELPWGVNQARLDGLRPPVIAKPVSGGSSIGMRLLTAPLSLDTTVSADEHRALLLEEFIAGETVTVAVLNLAGVLIASPAVRVMFDSDFYDADVKLGGSPAHPPTYLGLGAEAVEHAVRWTATAVHQLVGCRGYSRVDFIVTDAGEHYVLEVNTIPGLTRGGNFVACTKLLGLTYDETVLCVLRSCLLPHPELVSGR